MSEETHESILEKYPFLGRNWYWIILAILIIAGMYLMASWLWRQLKGETEEEAKD